MGADYKGQDKAIAELSALSREAKEFLNHHICNPLNVVIVGVEATKHEIEREAVGLDTDHLVAAEKAAWHIIDDLHMAGIRNTRR